MKKWLGVTKTITVSVLYRNKDCFGLNLKRLLDLYKFLQVSKGYSLKNSKDPKVKEVYEHKVKKQEGSSRWGYTNELSARERDLYFRELVGVTVKGRMGLGSRRSLASEKDKLKDLVAHISEQDILLTLVDKGVQGQFLTWENTMQLDLGWNNLIYNYKMSPALLKFHLNATHDVANTPANMSLWNYADTGHCPLCGWRHCNIKHILVACNFSLNNKRYNWRHDNVLRVIAKALTDQIEKFNSKDFKLEVQEWTVFKSSSSSYQKPITKMKRESPFEKGHDWKIIWDEDDLPAQFPQHIYGTAKRPDIVVWSDKERVLVELTVGDESNFSDQVERKQARYNKELIPGLHGNGCKAQLLTVKV